MEGKLLNGGQVGTVALVEAPVSQWYARRARIVRLVVGFVSDAVVTAVASVFCPLVLAVAIGAVAGLVLGFAAGVLVRVWPVLRALWWWSIEITTGVLVVAGPVALAHVTAWWVALSVLLSVATACVAVRPARRFLAMVSWCLVVRHRLRSCFAGILRGAAGSRPGSLPLVLWARPTPAGERVWLWLRPGLELADLDGKTGRIGVACWAKPGGLRVVNASERFAALIRVDVARRDPLAVRIDSPLALLIPGLRDKNQNQNPSKNADAMVPAVGLELADIEEPPAPDPRGGRR